MLEHINTSLLEVDPILHLVLFRASPESEYSLLIPWVPAPVILTGISMRIESLKSKSAQQKVSNQINDFRNDCSSNYNYVASSFLYILINTSVKAGTVH